MSNIDVEPRQKIQLNSRNLLLLLKIQITNQPYLSYGIKACFSCRAFFRRAHQKTRTPAFKCRAKTNDCVVDEKTRKLCQRCRYQKCLAKGMQPELVLNNDQKKVKFDFGKSLIPSLIELGDRSRFSPVSYPHYYPTGGSTLV